MSKSYEWHTQDICAGTRAPPCARFEAMFGEDIAWEDANTAAMLAYLGIEARCVSDFRPEHEMFDALTREALEQFPVPGWAQGGGWKLASAWDDEDGRVHRRFTRPLPEYIGHPVLLEVIDMEAAVTEFLATERHGAPQVGLFQYRDGNEAPLYVVRDHMEESKQQRTVALFRSNDRDEADRFFERTCAARKIEAAMRGAGIKITAAHAETQVSDEAAYELFSNSAKGALIGEFSERITVHCPECEGTPDDECALCHGTNELTQRVPVTWDTIKKIVKAAIPFLPIGSRKSD